ncbi:MAG: nucleoside hydrolase-like domain-containing protein [Candidatus Latescibacterota bacterium]|jgi:hypothetical protein
MSQSHKPRLIVTTDINNGPGDPDDRQSLCHLVLYADVLDIRGIVPDRFSPKAIETCHIAFDLYEEDFNSQGPALAMTAFLKRISSGTRRSRQHRKPR